MAVIYFQKVLEKEVVGVVVVVVVAAAAEHSHFAQIHPLHRHLASLTFVDEVVCDLE